MKSPVISPDLVVFLAGVTAALHIGKVPPALPALESSLGVTLIQAGFLLSLVQMAGMSFGLLIGSSAESLGLRRSMVTGLIILCITSVLSSLAKTPSPLLWLRGFEGIGFLLVAMPAPALIRRLVNTSLLHRRLGLWGCYMGMGTGLALFFGPWIISATSWQGWWLGLAAITSVVCICVTVTVPADETSHLSCDQNPSPGQEKLDWITRLKLTLSTPGPWLIAAIFAAYSSQWIAVIGFLPSTYIEAGLEGSLVGALTAAVAFINILGNFSAGQLLHRGFRAQNLLYTGFIVMSLGTYLTFSTVVNDWFLVRYLAVLSFSAVGGMIPAALFSLSVHLAPNEQTISTTVGWMQQWSSLGQFFGAPIVAFLADAVGGWQYTWAVTLLLSFLGVLLSSHSAIRKVF
ncbi:MAG: MFS transporter [Deltaproteobacteria bacterium]|nr:MFS transporter [Deltaproteobacteria bacterium]